MPLNPNILNLFTRHQVKHIQTTPSLQIKSQEENYIEYLSLKYESCQPGLGTQQTHTGAIDEHAQKLKELAWG